MQQKDCPGVEEIHKGANIHPIFYRGGDSIFTPKGDTDLSLPNRKF